MPFQPQVNPFLGVRVHSWKLYFKVFFLFTGAFLFCFTLFQIFLIYRTESYFSSLQKQQAESAWKVFRQEILSHPKFSDFINKRDSELSNVYFSGILEKIEKAFYLDFVRIETIDGSFFLASSSLEADLNLDSSKKNPATRTEFVFEKDGFFGKFAVGFSLGFPQLAHFQKTYLRIGFFVFSLLYVVGIILVRNIFSSMNHAYKNIEESTRLAQIGRISAGVAHDIRNPLGIIHLQLEQLREMHQSDKETIGIIGQIHRSLKRINHAVGTLMVFREEEVDLSQIIEVREIILELVEQEKASWIVVDVEAMALKGNPDLFYRAMGNLLRNAMDAVSCCETPQIIIRGFLSKEKYRIEIEDNGEKIVQIEKIFQPFFTTKKYGTGLGLLVVQDFVRRHGGECGVLFDGVKLFWMEIPFKVDFDGGT